MAAPPRRIGLNPFLTLWICVGGVACTASALACATLLRQVAGRVREAAIEKHLGKPNYVASAAPARHGRLRGAGGACAAVVEPRQTSAAG